jgi:hypothetical protein
MSQPFIPELPCLCAGFRRTARALTQVYEEALRPLGLRATQFTILQALELAGEVSQGRLGEMLAMDSTSLTRTLAIVRRTGWVSEQRGEDRRERRRLGKPKWESLLQLTHYVTEIAKTEGGSL